MHQIDRTGSVRIGSYVNQVAGNKAPDGSVFSFRYSRFNRPVNLFLQVRSKCVGRRQSANSAGIPPGSAGNCSAASRMQRVSDYCSRAGPEWSVPQSFSNIRDRSDPGMRTTPDPIPEDFLATTTNSRVDCRVDCHNSQYIPCESRIARILLAQLIS